VIKNINASVNAIKKINRMPALKSTTLRCVYSVSEYETEKVVAAC